MKTTKEAVRLMTYQMLRERGIPFTETPSLT